MITLKVREIPWKRFKNSNLTEARPCVRHQPDKSPLILVGMFDDNEGAVSFASMSGLDDYLKFTKLANQLNRKKKHATVIVHGVMLSVFPLPHDVLHGCL